MNSLQEKLLSMYKELREILLKNKIDYFGIGGTAIGAYREKGFIPGDDDIDIAIKEEDLAKFRKAIENSRFSLVSKNRKTGKDVKRTKLTYFLKVFDDQTWLDENSDIVNMSIDVMIAQKQRIFSKFDRFKWNYYHVVAHAKKNTFKVVKNGDGIGVAIGYAILKSLYVGKTANRLEIKMKKLLSSRKVFDGNKYYAYHVRFDEYGNVNSLINLKFEDTVMPVTKTFAKDIEHIFGDIFIGTKPKDRITHKTKLLK